MTAAAAPVLHLRSLGQLTADLQRPYAALARAVEVLGVAPAVTIDGVAYYDATAVARVTRAFDAPVAPVNAHQSNRGARRADIPPSARTTAPARHRRGRGHVAAANAKETPE